MKEKTLHSQPTIQKSGEIALFYNIAYNRLCQFIAQYEGEKDFDVRRMLSHSACQGKYQIPSEKILKPVTYYAIYDKILDERQGGNVMIGRNEIILVHQVLFLFEKIRNYYSHFYHQDPKQNIPKEFAEWLKRKAEEAELKYATPNRKRLPFKIIDEKRINNTNKKYTQYSLTSPQEETSNPYFGQGVDFLLSFFLPRSFMSEYLNQRKGYKKTFNESKDEVDYTFFRNMCLHYSKRDSNRQNYLNEKGKISNLTYQDYFDITALSYLNSLPAFLEPELDPKYFGTTTMKNPNNFLQLAITIFSLDQTMPHKNITEWRIINKEFQNEDISNIPKQVKPRNTDIINAKKNKKYVSGFTNEYDQLAAGNKQVTMKIKQVHGNKSVDILISEREIVSLLYQKLYEPESFEQGIKKLVSFTNQYAQFLNDALNGKVKQIEAYEKLKPYLASSGAKLNSAFHLFFEDEPYNQENLCRKIKNKLDAVSNKLEMAIKKEVPFEFLNKPTLVYETPDKVKGMESKSPKDWAPDEIKAREEWLLTRKEWKGIRHQKMQLALYAKDIILGRKTRFRSKNEKETFLAYCYLLDKSEGKFKRQPLIKEIKGRLEEKIENPTQNTFNTRYLKVLENSASFDDFVIESLKLAKERIEDLFKILNSGASEETLFFLSKKFEVRLDSILQSKNQPGKERYYDNRVKEVLSAYIDNIRTPETYYLILPKRFFNPFNNAEESFSKTIREKEEKLYQSIEDKWKRLLKNDAVKLFEPFDKILENKNKSRIKNAKKVNYEIIKEILIKKAQAGMHTKQTENAWKFVKTEEGVTDYSSVVYSYNDFRIMAPLNKLRAFNILFSNDRFDKILERLKKENPGKNDYSLDEIKISIFRHLRDSREFISKGLELDMKYAEKYQNGKIEGTKQSLKWGKLTEQNLKYIKMFKQDENEIVRNLGIKVEDWNNWVEMRNKAFHADILPPEESYEKLCKAIEEKIKKLNTQYRKN